MSGAAATTLSAGVSAALTAMARALYPHAALPDDVYRGVAERLAEATSSRPVIEAGVARLTGFAQMSNTEQTQALLECEGSEFFELVRSTAVVVIYGDPRTWAAFGYEGPSFDRGGYLHRGFNDLDWLPDPEEAQ